MRLDLYRENHNCFQSGMGNDRSLYIYIYIYIYIRWLDEKCSITRAGTVLKVPPHLICLSALLIPSSPCERIEIYDST